MGLPYSQPSAGGDKFEPSEHLGHLLLFFPIRYNPEEPTKFGTTTSANTDVIDVDTGQFMNDAKVFGNLANSLRNDVGGGVVLGRLGQGVNTKGNPPWILLPFDETQDPPRADPYLAQYKAGQFKQPAAGPSPATAPPPQNAYAPATAPAAATAAPQNGWQPPAPNQYQQQVMSTPPPATPQAGWNQSQNHIPPAQAAPPAGPPAQTAPPAPAGSAVDPNLVAFLTQRGVNVTPDMNQATCEAIARALPQ